MSSPKILIMAGGTGGHIFPGLAVAAQLKEMGWEIVWLGTAERMEAQLVPKHGYPIQFINISGVRKNGLLRLLKAPLQIVKALMQAMKVIREEKPDLVLGMGGYASGPGGIAAWLCGVPLLLHEQNAAPGMTNRILARFAKKVLTAFPAVFGGIAAIEQKVELVGNPVRSDLVAELPRAVNLDAPLNLLIIGGSLGARVLNEVVPKAVAELGFSVNIWHQCGKGNDEAMQGSYPELPELKVAPFIDDMAEVYRWADLMICRAGALTVAEVAAAGMPAIFVPLPHAVDDHQTKNALWLVENGAAKLLPQRDFNSASLAGILSELNSDRAGLAKMGELARGLAMTDATARIAALCVEMKRNVEK